jgi:hypothetical protein
VTGVDALGATAAPVPSDVRAQGKDAEQTYRPALTFERTLLEQLTKPMAKDMVGSDSGDGDGAGAATSAHTDMLPGTLADAVTGAGGLGLAHDLLAMPSPR